MIGLNKIGLNQVQLNRLYLNAPFPVYRKMAGGGSSGDGFPVLPGDVTRWHFGGLTNEMMAAMDDPRLEDADGKGRFLSFKNFAWRGMSGVGGYEYNFLDSKKWEILKNQVTEYTDNKLVVTKLLNTVQVRYKAKSIKFTVKISGLEQNNSILRVYDNFDSSKAQEYFEDGIYEINYKANDDAIVIWFYLTKGKLEELDIPITIEQLPLYPGFILGDGVDDFAVTEKELNFEDTYTVYTAFIPLPYDPPTNMVLCGKDYKKDFYVNYGNALSFYTAGTYKAIEYSTNCINVIVCKRNATTALIKNLNTGESAEFTAAELIQNPGLYCLWKSAAVPNYARAAIAGQTICNGYFSTDEDDEKVLNYYKQEYPWLFPDQAWTVTGKTNEDIDRATIANITGNGNNLVLSNFGFAENSGYGLYGDDFSKWLIHEYRVVATKTSKLFSITSIKEAVSQLYYQSTGGETARIIPSYTIKVTGLTDGQKIIYKNNQVNLVSISSDGIHKLPSFEFLGAGSYYGFELTKIQESCDITIEQIPDYEGYLVTDGVDDKINSSMNFKINDDFTIVGDWGFLENKNDNCGLLKVTQIYIYNYKEGMRIYLKQGEKAEIIPTKFIRSIDSKGIVYDENFNSYQIKHVGTTKDIKYDLNLGFVGSMNFTKIAFKNLAIYQAVLSKEDCIKAYNYLQTLKSK